MLARARSVSRAGRYRAGLIATLAVAAVLSGVGNELGSPFLGWLSFPAFLVAVFLYFAWRREAQVTHRANVFAQEAKTSDETRTGPDQ